MTYGIYPRPVTSRICLSRIDCSGSHFTGNTSQAIGMYFNASNRNECVRILDPVYTGDPKFNRGSSNIIPISNLSTISQLEMAPGCPILPFSGWNHPIPGVISLKRQTLHAKCKTGKQFYNLAKAKAKGLAPSSGGEYLPFIEAFAQTGQWSQAYDLSITAQKINLGLEAVLCNNWDRFQQSPADQIEGLSRKSQMQSSALWHSGQ